MKRSIAMILAFLLLLAGCGQKAVTDISTPTTAPVISISPTDPSTPTDPIVSKPDDYPVFVVHKLTLSDEDQEKIEKSRETNGARAEHIVPMTMNSP